MIHRNELVFSLCSGLTALAAIVALPAMVAKPKLLFGRSLSAMEPTLFPYIVLSLILFFSILTAAFAFIALRRETQLKKPVSEQSTLQEIPVFRVVVFFIVLVAYGLLLKPAGFLISSFLAITVISLLLGNRNWLQIALFAFVSPVCLFLLATRGLLVSLPELNPIELFYAGVINWIGG